MVVPEARFALSELSGSMLLEAAVMVLAFVGVLFVGSVLLPGRRVVGPDLDGKAPVYKLNGLALFLLTVLAAMLAQIFGWFSLSVLHSYFAALFVAANGLAVAVAGWLYWRSVRAAKVSQGGWRGFLLGLDLNPTCLGVDLKLFSYRPSLIALALFNVSFAVAQLETRGELMLAMVLYQVFTFLYVLNYFQFEYGMIHTWDMISERFGWTLVWGDYVLVPFFYSLAGWWLVGETEPLPPGAAAAVVLLFVFGFWLFRGANEQKHRFKHDLSAMIWGRPARSLDGRLLVSGFWGIGRHLNYTGEICVYVAFAATTGLASWVPYLLPLWLAGLLWHRSRRDENRCRVKYGELWERYTRQVRFSMLPFVH